VTVRAGTAYRKIWRLVNNFFARIIRFTVQKFQLFCVIFCIIIFSCQMGHAAFYIDCHRMTVPENILLQKKHCIKVNTYFCDGRGRALTMGTGCLGHLRVLLYFAQIVGPLRVWSGSPKRVTYDCFSTIWLYVVCKRNEHECDVINEDYFTLKQTILT